MKKALTLLTLSFLLLPLASHAACSSPSGNEAEIIYNDDYNVMQFCNGTNWISMSSAVVDSGIPSGAVMSFNLASCPTGWSEYTLARGRFIRGIDSTGTNDPDGVRALGNTQTDALQNITAEMSFRPDSSAGWPAFASGSGAFASGGSGYTFGAYNDVTSASKDGQILSFDASRVARTDIETRPKNVALLFCEKD